MTIIITDIDQHEDREKWLAMRCGVVTGTGFAKVMSKGSGKTRSDYLYQLATEKITGRPADETPSNFWMERGIELEDSARAAYMLQTGNAVDQCAFVYLNEHKRIGVSPDGLIGDDGMWEAKCPKLSTHVGYLLDERRCPPTYTWQVQGQMWVANRKWCDFCSYNELSHVELMTVRVDRDEKLIDELSDEVSVFLTDLDMMEMKLRKIKG